MLRFALPLLISQLFQQLYNAADSIIVGKFIGTNALAAVSSSGNMIFLFIGFFEGLAVGAGVLISKNFGAGDYDEVSKTVHTSLAVAVLSGIFLTVAGVALTPTILILINTDKDILPEATEYFRWYFAGALSLVLYNICRGIMTAVGDSRRPLFYLIFSSCLNIGLDLLFVGAFKWQVWAAAFATTLSQAVSAVLCIITLCKEEGAIKVNLKKIKIHKKEFVLIIKYGVPSGVQNSVIGFANIVVLSQINSFGKIATATYGTYSKIEGFTFVPITAFCNAITTFVSQNLGARQYDRAGKGARFGILLSAATAELIGVLYILLRPMLFSLFTSDAEVFALSKIQVTTIVPFYALLALAHSIAAVCRGAGKAAVPMYIMLGIWCVVRISYILTVMHLFGDIRLVYWAYPITWGLSDIIFVIHYFKSDWLHGFDKKDEING